jgi:hypothetical protein
MTDETLEGETNGVGISPLEIGSVHVEVSRANLAIEKLTLKESEKEYDMYRERLRKYHAIKNSEPTGEKSTTKKSRFEIILKFG